MSLVATEGIDGTVTVALPERFDFQCYDDFHAEVIRRIKASSNKPTVVFNFRGTKYIDSAGLGMLLLAREQATGRGGRVQLFGVSGRAGDVLRLAHFDRLFSIDWAA